MNAWQQGYYIALLKLGAAIGPGAAHVMTSVPNLFAAVHPSRSVATIKAEAQQGVAKARQGLLSRAGKQTAEIYSKYPGAGLQETINRGASLGFRHPLTGAHIPGQVTPEGIRKHLPIDLKAQDWVQRHIQSPGGVLQPSYAPA